jgi:proton glutamate symport protein
MKTAILKHPVIILGGAAAGIAIGSFNAPLSEFFGVRDFARMLSLPGGLYIFFLQMTVIPITVAAIASSLGKIIREKKSSGLIRKIIFVFTLCMITCAALGMAAGIFGKPGLDTQAQLSQLLDWDNEILEVALNSEYGASAGAERSGQPGFFMHPTPPNTFQAISLSGVIALLFLSIVFGIAIGSLPDTSASLLINLCTAIFQAFLSVINRSLYFLPLALICLLAGQTALVGVQAFGAMSKLISLYFAVTVVVFIITTLIIWKSSKIRNPLTVASMLLEPTVLAFATRSPMAVLPSALNGLENKIGLNPSAVNLTLPIGATLGRFGSIAYFALAVFFIAQVYNTTLEPVHYLMILFGAIFAGTAAAGAPGITALPLIGLVLEPLNLPMEVVLIMFIAIDSIIDPLKTTVNVHVNMAAAALVAKNEDGRDILELESGMMEAERKIQQIFSAKLAGTANASDERMLNKLNDEINRLREEKRQIGKP